MYKKYMYKKLTATMLICSLLFIAAGCADVSGSSQSRPSDTGGDPRISVVTTIFPPYDFVREIAGEHVSLSQLLPPGAESHSFEPSPSDIISIQSCDVFIYNGGDSDIWVDRILSSMDEPPIEIVKMMELVPLSEEEHTEGMEGDDHDHEDQEDHEHHEHDGGDDHDHGYEYDEHVWTSPVNAQKIVSGISEALIKADPENRQSYEEGSSAYIDELSGLDQSFRELSENAASHLLIFGDRFPFRYFADEYGFKYYAAFPGCSTQTEAAASTVAFLIEKAKAENVRVVFHIEFSNETMAETIAAESVAEVRLLHSCHNVSAKDMEEGVGYLSLMEQNLRTLEEVLS